MQNVVGPEKANLLSSAFLLLVFQHIDFLQLKPLRFLFSKFRNNVLMMKKVEELERKNLELSSKVARLSEGATHTMILRPRKKKV